jgi:SSS family solute:Na+ symporter
MIIVAIIYIPIRVGGWGHIFSVADTHLKATNPKTGKPNGSLILEPAGEWAYATLALGSALALFMYPHNITGVFAANRRKVIRRNVAALPAYSLVLGLIALLGYMALAAPGVPEAVKANGANAQLAVPFLFQSVFPSWFAGIAFAAIVIGALVPAAIMSIAAANLFTRNIWKEYFRPQASNAEQTRVSQTASLVVKLGALVFVIFVKSTYAIQLQLLGGIWIVQTFPAIVAGLYTRWFHRWALVIGWAVAMVFGTVAAYRLPAPGEPGTHFGASTDTVPVINHTVYIGLTGLVINLVIAVLLTLLFRAFKMPGGSDETRPHEYVADPEPAAAERIPVAAGTADAG